MDDKSNFASATLGIRRNWEGNFLIARSTSDGLGDEFRVSWNSRAASRKWMPRIDFHMCGGYNSAGSGRRRRETVGLKEEAWR